MTATISSAKTCHGDEPLHACGLHGVDQDASQNSEKSFVPSKTNLGEKSTPRVWITTSMSRSTFQSYVWIERVLPDTLSEFCVLDWYACARTRQGPNAVAGAKCCPRRFKSDPAAGTYDENIGHNSPNSYLFSGR